MIRLTQRPAVRSVAIGAILTFAVLWIDHVNGLPKLEQWAYDSRFALWQFFTPQPTDRIVHLDIDDGSLEAIGRWPWPRATLARMVDEINLARPKVVALDIFFSDSQQPRYAVNENQAPLRVDDDAELAAALSNLHNAVLPFSFSVVKPDEQSAREAAATSFMGGNPELSPVQLSAIMRATNVPQSDVTDLNLFVRARRQGLHDRIAVELDHGSDTSRAQLIARLLPHTDPTVSSPLLRVLDEEFAAVHVERDFRRFGSPAPGLQVPPVQGTLNLFPLPAFSAAALHCGFAKYDIFDTPILTSMPLFVQFDHRVYPQLGLVVGCALADADLSKVTFELGRVVIPRRNGPPISIPTHTYHSRSAGMDVSLISDIPWFGTSDWLTMYDWPTHRLGKNHLSINAVWDICLTRDKIRRNNANIDKAVAFILGDGSRNDMGLNPKMVHAYADSRVDAEDTPAREKIAATTLKELQESGWLEMFAQTAESELSPIQREQHAELNEAEPVLRKAVEQNRQLIGQLETQRGQLSKLLKEKAAIIGFVATASTDEVTTSLHARCPGVVTHGVIANAVLTGRWWRQAPSWIGVMLIIIMGFATAAGESRLPPLRAAGVALALAGGYALVNGLVIFDYFGWIVPLASPVEAVVAVWAGITLHRLVIEVFERQRIATEAAIIHREMELAQAVQFALIPTRPPEVPGLEAHGWTLAASMTGGDCYDLWQLGDGRLGILVADASGHGLAPAMVVSQVRTLVRAMCDLEPHPQGLLARVNARLAEDLEPNRFVTAFLGFLNADGQLHWASAGHGPMYWYTDNDGEIQSLDSTALPLGIQSDWLGDEPGPPLDLNEGGLLLVFSDGIFEAPAPGGEQFGVERVQAILNKSRGQTLEHIVATLRTAVQAWQQKTEPIDDQTIVIARRPMVASLLVEQEIQPAAAGI